MGLHQSDLDPAVRALIRDGTVIPAQPLALDSGRRLDRQRQRALTRYYLDAEVGGLAVGVHTTQFAIREVGLYEPVLRMTAETVAHWADRPVALVAGLCGSTDQACREARVAVSLGYHAGLLSLAALAACDEDEIIAHCRAVAEEMPLFGFYLQPAVGGLHLRESFWRRFAAIDNLVAIKVAPFDRYRTLDVFRGVLAAGAAERVTLYTGNDDHIVLDLTTPFDVVHDGWTTRMHFKGGLLGHWSVWTGAAVRLFDRCRKARIDGRCDPDLLALDARVTDCNSAFFDVANGFRGCIAGCHEVLRRQGLLNGTWCLDPHEGLSPGQSEQIDRVLHQHGDLSDDAFVRERLQFWLS